MPKSNSGQSLLVILLVMAVILTIGLAVVSYSITDIKISQQEEESARAFSAAEAGIEESLRAGAATSATVGEITANVTEAIQGGGEDFNFGESKFPRGELANVWLIDHTEEGALNPAVYFPYNGQIKICWGEETTLGSSTPALELALVYQQGGEYKVVRQGYDPVNGRTVGFDESLDKDGGNCASGLAFSKDISLDGGVFNLTVSGKPYLLRLKLLYNSELQPIAVQANSNLPEQGKCYESAATVQVSGITRKIRQCQFFQAPPEIFDYVLFSTSDLVK
ncbi:hypothetical protein MUP35_04095 [Patescibacteria group bacterium]|nr:hypothetical protein [Patescibacteria group bacterium]